MHYPALVLLDALGVQITPLLTALGVGGLAVALALQDSLSNLFAGVHLLADKPIRVGDYEFRVERVVDRGQEQLLGGEGVVSFVGDECFEAGRDVGDAQGEVEAAIEGEPVQIAFNARYLQEALANVDYEQLALEFSGPLSPGVLRPTGDDHDYVHVIMPVRTPS